MQSQAPARGAILIVEDNLEVQEVLVALFQGDGYEVTWAANGQEALCRLREGPLPSIILLDWLMPIMNGWEFLCTRQQDPALAAIPVVVLSSVADAVRCRTLPGDVECLMKPVNVKTLLEMVARKIARSS